MSREITFDLFRYQLLPNSITQLKLYEEHISIELLKERKNELFKQALLSEGLNLYHTHNGDLLRHRIISVNGEVIVMKLGKKRNVVLTNENFEDEEHSDFPSIYVILNNDPGNQKIAISRDKDAFSDSFVVANILEENFTRICQEFSLEVVVNPILDQSDFWELIHRYKDRITQLQFNLVRPNLANISATFRDEIRQLTDDTNSLHTKVELNAPKDSVLENIDESNERVKALVDYGIQGGSPKIHLRIKGMKRVVKTEKTISTISIESVDLSGSPENVNEIYRQITND